MKKIIILLIIIGLTYYIWESMQPNQEVIEAKKQMGIQVSDTNGKGNNIGEAKKEIFKAVDSAVNSLKEEVSQVVEEKKVTPTFSIDYLTDNKFLELDKLEVSDLADKEIELTGKTLEYVDKIRVLYTNRTSNFPDDDFTLKKFKPGDKNFLYRAFYRYETFDFGTNIYTFFAYSGDKVSKLELTIYYPNPDEIKTGSDIVDSTFSQGKIDTTLLPTGANYGNPIKLGEDKITYSDIKGLEIKKYSPESLTCDSNLITKVVQNQTSTWSWWNTCRPSKDKNYISFFVLDIKDNKYTYAKHYFSNQYYAIIELESGEYIDWNTLKTIEEKNTWLKEKNNELKKKNDNFKIIKITDNLFTEMNQ